MDDAELTVRSVAVPKELAELELDVLTYLVTVRCAGTPTESVAVADFGVDVSSGLATVTTLS